MSKYKSRTIEVEAREFTFEKFIKNPEEFPEIELRKLSDPEDIPNPEHAHADLAPMVFIDDEWQKMPDKMWLVRSKRGIDFIMGNLFQFLFEEKP